jgi:hypothetical protein
MTMLLPWCFHCQCLMMMAGSLTSPLPASNLFIMPKGKQECSLRLVAFCKEGSSGLQQADDSYFGVKGPSTPDEPFSHLTTERRVGPVLLVMAAQGQQHNHSNGSTSSSPQQRQELCHSATAGFFKFMGLMLCLTCW